MCLWNLESQGHPKEKVSEVAGMPRKMGGVEESGKEVGRKGLWVGSLESLNLRETMGNREIGWSPSWASSRCAARLLEVWGKFSQPM